MSRAVAFRMRCLIIRGSPSLCLMAHQCVREAICVWKNSEKQLCMYLKGPLVVFCVVMYLMPFKHDVCSVALVFRKKTGCKTDYLQAAAIILVNVFLYKL